MPDIDMSCSTSVVPNLVSASRQADYEASFLRGVIRLGETLKDGFDHPEVWTRLQDVATFEDVSALLRILDTIRSFQSSLYGHKTIDLISAVLMGASGDHAGGIALLETLEIRHPHCPQVAGAHFYVTRIGDPDRTADLSSRFCDAPFVKFETLVDGTVAPCCSLWTQKRLGRLDNQNADEIWNSISAQEMRESILDGSYRFCNKKRCTYIMGDTLPLKDDVIDPKMRTIIDERKVVLDTNPTWLFLAHDATCNLSCPSCRSSIFAASVEQEARFEKIEQQVLLPLLRGGNNALISVSGQGDPWSSPHYRSILRYMADHDLDVRLNLHTNALLMGEKRWNDYIGLENYRPTVDVSIDSCTPWVYDVVRRPGKFDRLLPNLEFIASKRKLGIFSEYHLNATIQMDNYHEMPAMVDFARALGADDMRMYMMQNTGSHISATFAAKDVGNAEHPLHLAFLETLRDPRLGTEQAHLYDVGTWRARSLEMELPSDGLPSDSSEGDLFEAVEQSMRAGALSVGVALCAAGRQLFPNSVNVIEVEISLLSAMGYDDLAAYRAHEAAGLSSRMSAAKSFIAA